MCLKTIILMLSLFLLKISVSKLNFGNTAFTQPTVITGAFELGTSSLTNAVTSIALAHQVTAFTPFAFGSATTSATQSGTATGLSLMGEVHLRLGAPVSLQGRKLKQQHLQGYPSFLPLRHHGTIDTNCSFQPWQSMGKV